MNVHPFESSLKRGLPTDANLFLEGLNQYQNKKPKISQNSQPQQNECMLPPMCSLNLSPSNQRNVNTEPWILYNNQYFPLAQSNLNGSSFLKIESERHLPSMKDLQLPLPPPHPCSYPPFETHQVGCNVPPQISHNGCTELCDGLCSKCPSSSSFLRTSSPQPPLPSSSSVPYPLFSSPSSVSLMTSRECLAAATLEVLAIQSRIVQQQPLRQPFLDTQTQRFQPHPHPHPHLHPQPQSQYQKQPKLLHHHQLQLQPQPQQHPKYEEPKRSTSFTSDTSDPTGSPTLQTRSVTPSPPHSPAHTWSVAQAPSSISPSSSCSTSCSSPPSLKTAAKNLPSKAWWLLNSLDASQLVQNAVSISNTTLNTTLHNNINVNRNSDNTLTHDPSVSAQFHNFFDEQWMKHYEELKRYYLQFGHTNVTRTTDEFKSLGNWVAEQRRKRRREKLSQHQVQLMDQLRFEWDRTYYFKTMEEKDARLGPSSSD